LISYPGRDAPVVSDTIVNFDALLTHGSMLSIRREREAFSATNSCRVVRSMIVIDWRSGNMFQLSGLLQLFRKRSVSYILQSVQRGVACHGGLNQFLRDLFPGLVIASMRQRAAGLFEHNVEVGQRPIG
jgi:hypothetical protein